MRSAILALFIILFIGSLFFSLERILYSDPSFILFRIINLGTLQPQEHRYGSFITQGFPLIASKLHLPLSWIVVLYSASFNLFYLAVNCILVLRLKEYPLAILMSFYFVLFVSDSYYWITNEVHQGIAWMFLFFGLILYFLKKNISLPVSFAVFTLLAFLSVFTHLLVLFPVVFLWIFFLLEKDCFRKKPVLIFSVILLLVCISKFFLSSTTGHYDSDKLYVLKHSSLKTILYSLSSSFVKEFLKRCMRNYWLVPLLFFAGIYSAVKLKKYKQLLLVLAFCFVYFMAMAITYNDFLPYYTESELMPATIILTALFVYYTIPALNPKIALLVLSGIFVTRVVYIGLASEKFTERKKWLFFTLNKMRKKNIKKAFIYTNELKQKEFLSYWSIPQESMIASALSKDRPNLTFFVADENDISNRLPKNKRQIVGSFESWDIESINKYYFSFDTTMNYQMVDPVPFPK